MQSLACMELRYGSNYFTHIVSFILHKSLRQLLLFNLQVGNLWPRKLKNLAGVHTAVTSGSQM